MSPFERGEDGVPSSFSNENEKPWQVIPNNPPISKRKTLFLIIYGV